MFTASTSLKAASGSISVRSSRSSLVVGNQVTVTVTVSSTSPLGSWEYSLNYDSSKLKLISGNTHIVDYASNGNTKVHHTHILSNQFQKEKYSKYK